MHVFASQDIAGHIVEFSGDQLGSRHIQTKLETASAEEKAMVFGELLPNMLQLSTDVFANCEQQQVRDLCSVRFPADVASNLLRCRSKVLRAS